MAASAEGHHIQPMPWEWLTGPHYVFGASTPCGSRSTPALPVRALPAFSCSLRVPVSAVSPHVPTWFPAAAVLGR